MTERLTVRSYLDIDNFDPLNIEVNEFKELANSMPKDANIDIPNAEKLASRFLRAADRCSEILSTLVLWEGKKKAELGKTKSTLFLAASSEGHRTVKDREAYAESHDDYIAASEEYLKALAMKKFFELKQKWFVEAHHLMKQRLRGEYKHQKASGFSETAGQDEQPWGEKSWK